MNPPLTTGILVINPGATSTKIAIFDGETVLYRENLAHESAELKKFPQVIDQFQYRRKLLEDALTDKLNNIKLLAIAGRGGPIKPLEGGTYAVNEKMLSDLKNTVYSDHASNHGALLAQYFADKYGVKAYIVDPVSVDNFTDLARISGLPEIPRKCRSHALNIKAASREAAAKIGKKVESSNFIVLHLGSGFSICALQNGRIVDVNDGLHGMGPYSVERAGALPIGPLVKICFSGKYTEEQLLKKLASASGLQAYLGTSDFKEALRRLDAGDQTAKLAVDGMLYQCAKEAGACAAVLKGKIDGIVITGGLSFAPYVIDALTDYLRFLAPIIPIPGEFEMEALARGVYRILNGEESAKEYV